MAETITKDDTSPPLLLDISDPKVFDFTGFFLPLTVDEMHVRADAVATEHLVQVLRRYVCGGFLEPGAELLPQNHLQFVLKQGALLGAVRYLLRQSFFRRDDAEVRYREVVQFLLELLEWIHRWMAAADPTAALQILNSMFDQSRVLYRAAAGNILLEDQVLDLERNGKAAGARFADPSKALVRLHYEALNNRLLIYLINYFGYIGGFDAILARLRNTGAMPLEALKLLLKTLAKLRPLAGDDFAKRIVPELPDAVFKRQLLDLDNKDLRPVTKKDIEEVDGSMRIILKAGNAAAVVASSSSSSAVSLGENTDEICDKFCLAFALKCLRSTLQDKKFNGLAHIEESIDSITKERKNVYRPPVHMSQVHEVEQKVTVLLNWIRENRIVELVFHRDNMRRELIVLTKKMIRFLHQEGELDPSHVALILEGILDHHHQKLHDVRDALYDTLLESAEKITRRDLAHQIWATVRRMDMEKHWCRRTVKLVHCIIEGTRERDFMLEMTATLWSILQDGSRCPMECVLQTVDTLPRIAQSQELVMLPDVLDNIRGCRSGLQMMRLLNESLNLLRSSDREVEANALVTKKDMFERELEELAWYKRQAKAVRATFGPHEQRDWDLEILTGRFPHLEAVESRLAQIAGLLQMARMVPSEGFLEKLWVSVTSDYVTLKERDMCMEWVMERCRDEKHLAVGLFERIFLNPTKTTVDEFVDSEVAFSSFARLFFVVNHDKNNLRLKTRDKIAPFDAIRCPYIGFDRLLHVVVRATPNLFARGKDMVLNLYLGLHPDRTSFTDSFRRDLVGHFFGLLDSLRRSSSAAPSNLASDKGLCVAIDRLVGLIKDVVVLTKPKDEPVAPIATAASAGGKQSTAADDGESKKPAFPMVLDIDRERVEQFAEMMGAAFPPEYCFSISALMLKDAQWSLERAIEQHMSGDMDARTASYLEKARSYKRYTPGGGGAGSGGGAGAAGPAAAPTVIGTPFAELISMEPHHYDTLFALLSEPALDRETIWALIKMLPADARLARSLSQELVPGNNIDWSQVLGRGASYQLLYSLEIVRKFIPTDGESESEAHRKTDWCKAFVHRGGFQHLFVLLERIARDDGNGGRLERSCLGLLLRIMFHFMRSELQASLGKSMEDVVQDQPLRFSIQSSTVLESAVPSEQLAPLMFQLLVQRATRANELNRSTKVPAAAMIAIAGGGAGGAGGPAGGGVGGGANSNNNNNKENEDTDVARFAAYLLCGSLLREPHLLDSMAEDSSFSLNLLTLLCCADAALKSHMANQLTRFCKDFVNDHGRPARRHPSPFFLGQALGAIPQLLKDDDMARQCSPIFQLIGELFGRCSSSELTDALSSVSWAESRAADPREKLLRSCCALIRTRPGKEGSPFVYEDQLLAGLFRVSSALILALGSAGPEMAGRLEKEERVVTMMVEDCLFGRGANSKCVAPATREAGLELLSLLCRDQQDNWNLVIMSLSAHHLAVEPISSWRPVEVTETKRVRFVGLRNLGATCYMNATIQQLYMMPELRNVLLAAPVTSEKRTPDNMLWQFQRVLAGLLHSDTPWCDTEPFVKTLRDGMDEPINTHRQEDAYDFLTRFQEQLEKAISGEDAKIFAKMFSVGMTQEIECRNQHAKATPQAPEPVLQVDFAPTIEACLEKTFALGGDPISDYNCEGCGRKVDILKRTMINASSDQLVVMLRRFEWDYEAAGGSQRKKLQDHFEIPRRVNLTPYTMEGVKQRRLGKQVQNLPQWEYELRGIVVHSGRTMDSGHYFSIIRDPETHVWYKFDDRDVTPFPEEFLNESHSKFIGECYMLLFQKVSADLTSSQLLLAAESATKIDSAILQEVEKVNATLIGERRYLENGYFKFLLNLMMFPPVQPSMDYPDGAWILPPSKQSAKDSATTPRVTDAAASATADKGKEEVAPYVSPLVPWAQDPSVVSAQMASVFVWESFVRARGQMGANFQETMSIWASQVLPILFSENVPACAWLLRELLTRRQRWIRYFLLECEEEWLREAFSEFLKCVVGVVSKAEVARGGLFYTQPLPDDVEPPTAAPVAPIVDSGSAALLDASTEESGGPDHGPAIRVGVPLPAVMIPVPHHQVKLLPLDEAIAAARSVEAQRSVGLSGQLIKAVLSLFETSRTHTKRFNQYFIFIRHYLTMGPDERRHVACGLFPSFANRPVRAYSLFLDYFMGDVSPIYKELPHQLRSRVPLSLGQGPDGGPLNLVHYFWCFWELTRSMDTGSPQMLNHPQGVAQFNSFVPLSRVDTLIWGEHAMLKAIIRMGYNPAATASIYAYWCWENPKYTEQFVAFAGECLNGALEAAWDTLWGLVLLEDSLRQGRIERLLGDKHFGAVQMLRERRVQYADFVGRCVVALVSRLDEDPLLLDWFLRHPALWQWMVDWLYKDEHMPTRRKLIELGGGPGDVEAVPPAVAAAAAGVAASIPPGVVVGGGVATNGNWHPNPLLRQQDDLTTMDMSEGEDDIYGRAPLINRGTYDDDDYGDDEYDELGAAHARDRWHGHH